MPSMGKPRAPGKNEFKNITIGERTLKTAKQNVGDTLNKISGIKEDSRYVDAKDHNKMGKNDFLRLLTVQLQNQDPLNPMDQQKFAAELAQFSQLEQMSNMNKSLDSMNGNKPDEKKFYAASFLGKEVVSAGTSLKLREDGELSTIPFKLEKDAKDLVIRILDQKGQIVKQIQKENIGRGSQTITWQGDMQDGQTAAKGDYSIQVYAWDKNAVPVNTKTMSSGLVQSVTFDKGEAVFKLKNGQQVFLRDVVSFNTPREKIAAPPPLPPSMAKNDLGAKFGQKPNIGQAVKNYDSINKSLD
jgi:flagellar basal-body rod modification protein FlgD